MDINGHYIGPDKDEDLRSANFAGADLGNVDLSYYDLSNANLFGANLAYANLSSTNLSNADLTGAVLTGADLTGTNLYNAKFVKANLECCNLSNSFVRHVAPFNSGVWRFSETRENWSPLGTTPVAFPPEEPMGFRWPPLDGKNVYLSIEGPDFSYANLAQAKLTGSKLYKSRFLFASLSGACFIGGEFIDSNFF